MMDFMKIPTMMTYAHLVTIIAWLVYLIPLIVLFVHHLILEINFQLQIVCAKQDGLKYTKPIVVLATSIVLLVQFQN
jgi:hypothetical protein